MYDYVFFFFYDKEKEMEILRMRTFLQKKNGLNYHIKGHNLTHYIYI